MLLLGTCLGNTKLAKLKMFAPFDSKLQVYMNPMFFLHTGQAERVWVDLCNGPDSMLSKHPEDFTLFQVGEFDDSSGEIRSIHPAVQVMSAVAAKKKPDGPLPLDAARR